MATTVTGFKDKINQAFSEGAPKGADTVFGPSQTRGFFEDLWKQGGLWQRDFGDLWNQKKFWENREMVSRAEIPGMKSEAPGATIKDVPAAPATPKEQLKQLVAELDPNARGFIEKGMSALATQADGQQKPVDLDELADNPETFVPAYLNSLPEEDREAFTRRMEEVLEENAPPLRQEATNLDEEYKYEPSVEAMAFMATVIGSGPAGRIHEALRQNGNSSALAGNYTEDRKREEEEEEQKRKAEQQIFQSIVNDINNIDRQLNALYMQRANLQSEYILNTEEIQKLREDRAREDIKRQQAQQNINNTQGELTQLQSQQATASSNFDAARDNLDSTGQQLIDDYADYKKQQSAFLGTDADGNNYTFTADPQGNITYWKTNPDGTETQVEDQNEINALNNAMQTPEGQQLLQQNQDFMQQFSSDAHAADALRRQRNQLTEATELKQEELRLQKINLENITSEQQRLDDRISKLENRNEEIQNEIDKINPEIAKLEGQREELIAQLPPEQREQYQQYMELRREQDRLNTEYNQIRDRSEENKQALDTAQQGVTTLQRDLYSINTQQSHIDQVQKQIQAKMENFEEIDIREVAPADKDEVAQAVLSGENSGSYIPVLELHMDEFSPEVQKQVIEATIKQDLELGREIDMNRFPPEMRKYAEQVMTEQAANAPAARVPEAQAIEQGQGTIVTQPYVLNTSRTGLTAAADDGQGIPPPGGMSLSATFDESAAPPAPEPAAPAPAPQDPVIRMNPVNPGMNAGM